MKQVRQIEGSPLGVSIYSVKSTPAELCGLGKEEIIFCLKGCVQVSYIYRTVTLHAGEFVAINHDIYYMSGDEGNICVSFYIDTSQYEKRYPDIKYRHHVCVGAYSEHYTPVMGFPTPETDHMLGMLLTLLYYYVNGSGATDISKITDSVLESLIEDFDVIYFMNGNKAINKAVHENLIKTVTYVYKHYEEKYTQERIAELLGISPNYVNEYLGKAGMSLKLIRDFAKLYAAERMLVETDKTVLEIAEETGFSNSRYLYSVFHSCLGCTPHEFRNMFYKERRLEIKYYTEDILQGVIEAEIIRCFLNYFTRNAGC